MKLSKYNFCIKHKDKWLLFNALSCALLEISEGLKHRIEQDNGLASLEPEYLDKLKLGKYIVDKDVNELELLHFLRLSEKFNSKVANITIVTTLACNFACVYCFEKHEPKCISNNVKDAIYNMIENLARSKIDINITWYGGEPLLTKSQIWAMSEKIIGLCKKYGVNYRAVMVTNAYLLDKNTISNMKKYKIDQIQTTLDGPKKIHDSMRRQVGNNANGTFDVIVKNLKLANEAGIKIHIRIHINKTNQDDLTELLQQLRAEGLNSCSVDLGQIKPYTQNCKDITNTCLNSEEFARKQLSYLPIFEKYDFTNSVFSYPKFQLSYCTKANSNTSAIIGPDGELYPCWVEVGDSNSIIGSIFEKNTKENISSYGLSYFMWSPFNYKACLECNVLPICMGGCIHCSLQKNTPDCQMWKYVLKELMIHEYTIKKEKIKRMGELNYIVLPNPV